MSILSKLCSDLGKLKDSPELKKSVIYIIASTIGYGIVFIQNFSLAYLLSISFFGKISLIISLFSTLYVLYTFGLNAVVLRFHFDKNYNTDRRKLISHIVSIWLMLGVILTVVLLLLGYRFLVIDRFLQIEYYTEFLFILFAAFLFSFTEILPNFFIAEEKPYSYAIYLVLSKAVIFSFLLLGVYLYGESSLYLSGMLFLSSLALFITGALYFKIYHLIRIKKENLKEILIYALPLMVYALGGIGYSHGYRVIVSNSLTYKDLAIFSLASQLASVYYLAAASSITGLYTKAYKRLEESNGKPETIRFYLRALIYVGLGMQILILPVVYLFLIYFKHGEFLNSFQILPVLIFGQFVFFLYGYNYILCTFYKKTNILTYSMFFGVITSLLLSFLMIRESNVLMAAIPVVCGLVVQFVISFLVIKRVVKTTHYLA